MNKRQAETAKYLLREEKQVVKDIKRNYTAAIKEIKERIIALQSSELTQSKIYQLEYQLDLLNTLTNIYKVLNDTNTDRIEQYLKSAYENSFLATLYDLQGQNIPLLFTYDDKQMINVIMTNDAGYKFSERLYTNTEQLKLETRDILSRGLASKTSYQMIAKQLSMIAESDYNKSVRIIRTEGHRVQNKAQLECQYEAESIGCDIKKEWCSALDNRTRQSHKKLDGQLVKVRDFFEVNGHYAQAPGLFNVAAEDINCRCSILQRATWALTEEEKKRYEQHYKSKATNFLAFKNEYHKNTSSTDVNSTILI